MGIAGPGVQPDTATVPGVESLHSSGASPSLPSGASNAPAGADVPSSAAVSEPVGSQPEGTSVGVGVQFLGIIQSGMLQTFPDIPSSAASSFSSSSSIFFSNGALSKQRLTSVSVRRAGPTSGRRLGCRCLFGLGVPELVVIAGVAALVFGPKQLPEIGRNIGKTVKSFQQAAKEFETELKKEPDEGSKPSLPEDPKASSSEDEKKELETSGTTENI
ncbi:sec-independent protein translocase protein TATA, chloroplastic-like [Asparagus officinalis]|uniref:sec-independent protein translocase protein TATA, chloroplastic-like n=1 Tax=Asparagus officinalis TaxID=4686 RepID=UPI00098E51E7|nr:sec-independent protein translocase protein TATA, chloroplastic-like [Asparagus officinalis]